MIEELVRQLAALQIEHKAEEDARDDDRTIISLRAAVAAAKGRLEIIETVEAQILDEWTGEDKMMSFDAGTLKFRTTKSMEIVDGGRLLEHIIENTSTDEAVNKYLKGFLLTPTKAYIDVHGLGEDIAKINSKTTVKLEPKSG